MCIALSRLTISIKQSYAPKCGDYAMQLRRIVNENIKSKHQ